MPGNVSCVKLSVVVCLTNGCIKSLGERCELLQETILEEFVAHLTQNY